jgi:hypothetical protein
MMDNFQKLIFDMMDNLDGFQKLVSTIKISWFSLDELSQDRTFWLRSRFFETNQDFCDFSGFLDIFLDLDWEMTWFLISRSQYLF